MVLLCPAGHGIVAHHQRVEDAAGGFLIRIREQGLAQSAVACTDGDELLVIEGYAKLLRQGFPYLSASASELSADRKHYVCTHMQVPPLLVV
jgi:hypothetical protein